MRTVTIVGIGRVGRALSLALDAAGYKIQCLVSNNIEAAAVFAKRLSETPVLTTIENLEGVETNLLFITTQDSHIRSVADRIAALGDRPSPSFAMHCSGALSSDELSSLAKRGYQTASVHPLVSVTGKTEVDSVFDGAYFAVEGSTEAAKAASKIVGDIGGRVFEIATGVKPLYHAAAVVACGHLVALFGTSIRMLGHCGLDEKTARKVLFPLVESTIANLRDKDPADALTGPFARGDVDVIAGHLQKMSGIADENIEGVYRILGLEALELAVKNGLSDDKISEMREIVLIDKRNSK